MEKIYYIEKSGRKRTGEYHNCEHCAKQFIRRAYPNSQWMQKQKYCSIDCRHLAQRRRITLNCDWCNVEFEKIQSHMREFNFCSKKCKNEACKVDGLNGFDHPMYNEDSKWNYRTRAFREYGKKCSNCGYDEHYQVLDVHHIDENRDNNSIDNLIVLCPTCHVSLTRNITQLKDRILI